MANGRNIVIELLPESAPNTVNSFIYTASRGYLDHHAIERIVPGNWVDVSYTAFGKKECRYLIPNEFELNPDVVPLDSHPGAVCMGGYGEAGLAGRGGFSSPSGTARTTREFILCSAVFWRAWMSYTGWKR